jgi:hypothetical protein
MPCLDMITLSQQKRERQATLTWQQQQELQPALQQEPLIQRVAQQLHHFLVPSCPNCRGHGTLWAAHTAI